MLLGVLVNHERITHIEQTLLIFQVVLLYEHASPGQVFSDIQKRNNHKKTSSLSDITVVNAAMTPKYSCLVSATRITSFVIVLTRYAKHATANTHTAQQCLSRVHLSKRLCVSWRIQREIQKREETRLCLGFGEKP